MKSESRGSRLSATMKEASATVASRSRTDRPWSNICRGFGSSRAIATSHLQNGCGPGQPDAEPSHQHSRPRMDEALVCGVLECDRNGSRHRVADLRQVPVDLLGTQMEQTRQ